MIQFSQFFPSRSRATGSPLGLLIGLMAIGLTATAQPLDPVTLQLKWKHQFQFAGYYAAVEQGYYREAGFDVRLREADDDREPAEVVLAGEAEFGIATSDLVLLHDQGRPVVVIAPIFQHSPLVFLAKEDSGITSIHDLVGRRVMIESHAAELLAYLEFEGIDRQELEIVPHRFDPAALIDNEVAAISAYSTDEPFLLENGGTRYLTFTPRATGIDFYGDTLFTTRATLERDPERVRRFRTASLRGWRYALDHPDELIDLILTRYSQRHSREHLVFEAEMTRRLILPEVVELGYQSPGRWRHIADTYHRLGMVRADLPLDGLILPTNADPDYGRFYFALGISSAIIGLLTVLSLHYVRLNRRIRQQAASLSTALSEITVLRGIIPICAGCKRVRHDSGYWDQVETYITERTEAEFSHCLCQDCMRRLYPRPIPEDDDPQHE